MQVTNQRLSISFMAPPKVESYPRRPTCYRYKSSGEPRTHKLTQAAQSLEAVFEIEPIGAQFWESDQRHLGLRP
jgi:hypothetical protein